MIGSGESSGRGLSLHGRLHGHAAPRLCPLRSGHVVRGKYIDLRYLKYLKYHDVIMRYVTNIKPPLKKDLRNLNHMNPL